MIRGAAAAFAIASFKGNDRTLMPDTQSFIIYAWILNVSLRLGVSTIWRCIRFVHW